jgi:CMP-N,N'-diacetyllegionaminic acid synthase
MIGDRRVLAIVPARAGSQGLPGKNVRPLAGKPLVDWTLDAAAGSALVDQVVVSSDDPQVLARVRPPMQALERPAALAGPEASVFDAIAHVLDEVGGTWDYVVLLQPTSPLRTAADVDAAIRLCDETGAPAVLTVSPTLKPDRFHGTLGPDGALTLDGARDGEGVVLNGAVYVGRPDRLRADRTFLVEGTGVLVMPPERGQDIDTLYDFVIAEALLPHARAFAETGMPAVRR